MPYDSRADLVARLAEIRAEITKARKAQSYAIGANDITVTRTNLRLLLEEEKWVLDQIQQSDAVTGTSGGRLNRVQFGRPA